MLNKEIEKILGEFNNSTIAKYYKQKGEKRAAAAALSKLRMEHGLASKMANASIKVGAHLKAAEASKLTNGASNGGKASIKQLLQWQKDNEHNIGEIAKVKDNEWCNKISESLTGRKLSKEHIENTKNGIIKYMQSLSPEERSEKFGNQSMLGKNHKDESKGKMREKANQRVSELGENYISKERKEKMREENGQRVVVYFFNSDNRNNKRNVSHLFLSSHQAQNYFKSGSIQHVLKNRAKRFGADKKKGGFQGYFAEYITDKKYEKLCELHPNLIN